MRGHGAGHDDGWPSDAGQTDAWQIVRDTLPGAADATLFALANGAIGVRGGIDELGVDVASFLPDGYVRRPIAYHERFVGFADHTDTRLNLPSGVALTLAVDGQPVDFAAAAVLDHRQALDLRRGVLDRRTRWRLGDGRVVEIAVERIVPLGGGPVIASRIAVTPIDQPAVLSLGLPLTLPGAGNAALADDDPRINARAGAILAVGRADADSDGAELAAGAGTLQVTALQRLACPGDVLAGKGAVQVLTAECAPGEALRTDRFVALAAAHGDLAPARAAAEAALEAACEAGFDRLIDRQAAALAGFWEGAALDIAGRDDAGAALAAAIRFNLFQLFQSASRDDAHSIAAKGLTGEGYEGHYFWDTEAYMLPVLALTQPQLARHILAYRHDRLGRARANARALGHDRGALYPWRTIGGDEASAHYPTGSAAYHINAAIAYAIEHYVAASGDTAFRFGPGAEMLAETARIWMDIGHFSARHGGAFLIHGVTGPDEYSALVDNNHYTNAMAQRHLRYAAATLRAMADRHPDAYAALVRKIGLDASEVDGWDRAAAAMHLPVDAALGVHPQDDGFLAKPRFDFAALPADRFPLLLHYHPMVLYRHQLCKQGDVVQAMVMAGDVQPLTLKARNLAYYEPLTTHDSTLSATAFAILAAETGAEMRALAYHRDSAFVDLEDRHGNTSHGAHLAALAGSWLALVQGWAGLRIVEDAAWLRPVCPADWRGYAFRFGWQGSRIAVEVDGDGTRYRLLSGAPVALHDHGRAFTLGSDAVAMPRPAIRAAIFDLDGVLTDTAQAHYRAWKRLCDEEGMPFDEQVNERLKGVDRAASLGIILEQADRLVEPDAFEAMMARKNGYYRAGIANFSPADLFPGVPRLLSLCRRAGLKVALASASRNASDLVAALGIADQFDFIADAATIARAKPDPEIFLRCAEALGEPASACVGIEDAAAGIAAIRAAGMAAIGIGDPAILDGADQVFARTADLPIAALLDPKSVTQSITAQ